MEAINDLKTLIAEFTKLKARVGEQTQQIEYLLKIQEQHHTNALTLQGSIMGLRTVLVAVLRTIDDPKEIEAALKAIQNEPSVRDGQRPEVIQNELDAVWAEVQKALAEKR